MIELLSNEEMAEADRLTIAAGTAGIVLMEQAGRAIADAVALRQPLGTSIAVVAGPGNNGGDGFVAARPLAFANAPELWKASFPVPRVDGHKYARGHAVVVSGGLARTGAARLAARGALRAGAGLVTIASPSDALVVQGAANLAVMVRAVDGAADLAGMLEDRRLNAVVLGPGGGVGEGMRELVAAVLAGER